jgi:hypothetical protein
MGYFMGARQDGRVIQAAARFVMPQEQKKPPDEVSGGW